MKTKKQQLIDKPYTLSSSEDTLDCFFSEALNLFCLRFNGILFSYKTWNGYVNKREYFIKKYNLS